MVKQFLPFLRQHLRWVLRLLPGLAHGDDCWQSRIGLLKIFDFVFDRRVINHTLAFGSDQDVGNFLDRQIPVERNDNGSDGHQGKIRADPIISGIADQGDVFIPKIHGDQAGAQRADSIAGLNT